MVEVTDKREGMTNQLLMKGHATVMEILISSFGEWPPKGLEINPALKHDQKVELKAIVPTRYHPTQGSAAGVYGDERKIRIFRHRGVTIADINSTLGHEGVHVLQGDNAHRKKRSFIDQIIYDWFKPVEQPVSNIIMQELTGQKEIHLSAHFNEAAKVSDVKYLDYISKGIEVQARIHQIMMEGYPRWGKMPANSDEFYAAMKNAGIKLPPEIEKHLAELPANSSARGFLACAMGKCPKVSDIQQINDSLSDAGKNIFWNKTMPALYADLIEMYGDMKGAKRFELGANLKSEVAQKNAPVAKQTTPSPS